MSLAPGARLGAYEILSLLGSGGMGEVYRARDTRLNREVAIKVLPDAFVHDAERLARFKREAQVLASLNHPHIAAIYGLEAGASGSALVLELVEGPTLADRIARGPVPIDEALATARQIAEALEAAHEHGIVHRDLKPANIKLTPDGNVKVLDFGLAKTSDSSSVGRDLSRADLSPTITSPAMTMGGVILGTAAYMSPEQAKGNAVDKRSDIWAFGCVLYEMLTGRRAFAGDGISETLAKVLERDPEWSALPAGLPPDLSRVLRRCLEKNLTRRLHDVADARIELGDMVSGSPAIRRAEADWLRPSWRSASVIVGALLIVSGSMFWVGTLQHAGRDPSSPLQLEIVLPPDTHLAVDTEHPVIALSPDGSRLAFVAEQGGIRRLYIRDLNASVPRVVPQSEGAGSPFFSPDGAWVAFFDESTLKKVPAGGGVPVPVHASTGISVNRGATWVSDDAVVYAPSLNGGLVRGSVGGDRRRPMAEWAPLTGSTESFAWPETLPGGRHLIFTDNTAESSGNARISLLSLDHGGITKLVSGGSYGKYSAGHILFARGAALYAVPLDASRFGVAGTERKILNLLVGQNGVAQFAAARNGTLAYVAGEAYSVEHQMVWVGRDGRIELLLDEGRTYGDPRLSHDGKQLAFSSLQGSNLDVWVRDLVRGSNMRITKHVGEDFEPVWGPDGRLAIASEIEDEKSGPALAWIQRLGETPEPLLRTDALAHWEFPSSWSPDGRWIAFSATRGDPSRDILLFPTTGPRTPITFLQTEADEAAPMFSPDGHWIAYVSDETGTKEVYVRPFPGPGDRVTVSTSGGVEPRWSRSGDELYYRNGNRMMAVKVVGGSGFNASAPQILFEGPFEMKGYGGSSANYDVASNGKFLMVRRKHPVTPTTIRIVVNWPEAMPSSAQP